MLVEPGVAGACRLGFLEAWRGRDVELERGGDGFRNERLTVGDPDPVAFALDGERLRERRRRPQGHFGAPTEERRDQAARVTAVRRSIRAVEASLYRQVLHCG